VRLIGLSPGCTEYTVRVMAVGVLNARAMARAAKALQSPTVMVVF
jgi:hypothetical protein